MLLEGRKHLRTGERFLVQVSSVHDPLLSELASVENQSPSGVRLATERSWELGLHVEVKSVAATSARGPASSIAKPSVPRNSSLD